MYYSNNLNILHNSVASPVNIDLVALNSVANVNIMNNIFKNNNTQGEIYYGNTSSSNIVVDHNVYMYDTLNANMCNDGFFGNYASPYDFMSNTSYQCSWIQCL